MPARRSQAKLWVRHSLLNLFKHLVEGPMRDPASLNKPSTLPLAESIRIGTIGKVDEAVMKGVLKAIREVLADMNVTDMAPLEG